MRVVLQRVTNGSVDVQGSTVGCIEKGLVVFLGISRSDTAAEANYLVDKLLRLRIFPDAEGKMNRSVVEAGGALLIVSQFTLYGDCRKGRRPSFDDAAPPEQAKSLYEYFVESARQRSLQVETGIFQASMVVHIVNDGPVTFVIDSRERGRK